MRLSRIFTIVFVIVAGASALYGQERPSPIGATERVDAYKNVHVFPNPAEEFVHIRVDQLKSSEIKLTIHNIIGNEIPAEIETVDEHEIRVRVKDFATGYYLVALRDDKKNFRGTYKFLKK